MASSQIRNIPRASVLRWNAEKVSVQCPFCEKSHNHSFSVNYDSTFRAPHCSHSLAASLPSYRFAYPFSTHEGTVAYEIDKRTGYFVALEAKSLLSEVEPLEQALHGLTLNADRFLNSKSWEEATEMITVGMEDTILRRLHECFGFKEESYTMKRLSHVLSRMVTFGDSQYLEDYLRTSTEAGLFLFGIDNKGESALSKAAAEKYPAIVKLLLDHGADPNHQDKEGRTPLMEATLWGRIENVKCLLDHGANRKLRDIHGHKAADLAELSKQNDEERYQRSGGDAQVYREDPFVANQARKVIFELLKDLEEPKRRETPTYNEAFKSHSFKYTDRGTIELTGPIAEFPVRNRRKTIASLQRRDFPPIAAMSGWSHGETKDTVSGKEWTAEVISVSFIVGYQLPKDHELDRGIEGLYSATHAEKQLVAYFISKHVLVEVNENDYIEPLQEIKPPVLLEKATIIVSRPPCGDCLQFIATVNAAFGLSISVLDRSKK